MVELRWFIRPGAEKILQYRVKHEVLTSLWSDWMDVKEVYSA